MTDDSDQKAKKRGFVATLNDIKDVLNSVYGIVTVIVAIVGVFAGGVATGHSLAQSPKPTVTGSAVPAAPSSLVTATPSASTTASAASAASAAACHGVASLTPYPVTQYGPLPPGTTIPSGAEVYCLTFEDPAVAVNIPTTGLPVIAPDGLPNTQISTWTDTLYSKIADPSTLTYSTGDLETIQASYTADDHFICTKDVQAADIHGLAGCPGDVVPGRIGAYLPTGTDVTAAIASFDQFNGPVPGITLAIQRPGAATIQRPNGLYVTCELDQATATLCTQSLAFLLEQFMTMQGLDTKDLGPAYAQIDTFVSQHVRSDSSTTPTPSSH